MCARRKLEHFFCGCGICVVGCDAWVWRLLRLGWCLRNGVCCVGVVLEGWRLWRLLCWGVMYGVLLLFCLGFGFGVVVLV